MKRNLHFKINQILASLRKRTKFNFLRLIFLNSKISSIKKKQRLQLCSAVFLNSKFKRIFYKKNFSFTVIRTQCVLTWRTRSVYSFFLMSRISARELISFGLVKGIRKASW